MGKPRLGLIARRGFPIRNTGRRKCWTVTPGLPGLCGLSGHCVAIYLIYRCVIACGGEGGEVWR